MLHRNIPVVTIFSSRNNNYIAMWSLRSRPLLAKLHSTRVVHLVVSMLQQYIIMSLNIGTLSAAGSKYSSLLRSACPQPELSHIICHLHPSIVCHNGQQVAHVFWPFSVQHTFRIDFTKHRELSNQSRTYLRYTTLIVQKVFIITAVSTSGTCLGIFLVLLSRHHLSSWFPWNSA